MKTILFSVLMAFNFMNNAEVTISQPSFPGGNEALVLFIQNELIYPESARENLNEGIAHVCFTVMPDGSIKNCEIEGIEASDLTAAIEAMIAKMPRWYPAMDGGKAVPRKISFNIRFDLTDV